MAFNPLPEKQRPSFGNVALKTPTVRVTSYFDNWSTHFNIPRFLLREAGLPDYPGGSVDLLIGDGEDAGSVALTAGAGFKLKDPTKSKQPASISFQTTRLDAAGKLHSTPCGFVASKGLLLIQLPANFPWKAAAPVQLKRV